MPSYHSKSNKELSDQEIMVNRRINQLELKGPRQKVVFQNGSGAEGQQPIFVQVNGHSFHIPREQEVDLPIEALDVIKNAVSTEYDGAGNKREVRRFAYQDLGQAEKTAIAEAVAERAEKPNQKGK